ncbi:MAG TPA: heavy-metal-associated domain-containing protein [Edaphocola sp.]|nr:heavy-metal-associated domain-containing protein [Edaphocola sp.]
MSEQQFHFKTSLNCENCVAKIKPALDNNAGIKSWSVDLTHPDKILSVKSSGASAEEIIAAVEDKGFDATLMA